MRILKQDFDVFGCPECGSSETIKVDEEDLGISRSVVATQMCKCGEWFEIVRPETEQATNFIRSFVKTFGITHPHPRDPRAATVGRR